jgi:hypothetical protein
MQLLSVITSLNLENHCPVLRHRIPIQQRKKLLVQTVLVTRSFCIQSNHIYVHLPLAVKQEVRSFIDTAHELYTVRIILPNLYIMLRSLYIN